LIVDNTAAGIKSRPELQLFRSLTLLIANLQRAHLWRSNTLRSFKPDRQDFSEAANLLRSRQRYGLADRCWQATKTFEYGAAALLVRPMEPKLIESFRNNLVSIFEEAGDLAMRVWTHRPGIKYHFIQDVVQRRFAVDSPIMQAHPLHKLDDPSDHSLDGRQVSLVVHPVVVRVGTHDGESYEQERVWVKAVVWFDA
jgi:hypothetical protein